MPSATPVSVPVDMVFDEVPENSNSPAPTLVMLGVVPLMTPEKLRMSAPPLEPVAAPVPAELRPSWMPPAFVTLVSPVGPEPSTRISALTLVVLKVRPPLSVSTQPEPAPSPLEPGVGVVQAGDLRRCCPFRGAACNRSSPGGESRAGAIRDLPSTWE